MTRKEFLNLRLGDVIVITKKGRNLGKKGVVEDMLRGPRLEGVVYVSPMDCEFVFHKNSKVLQNKEGFYGWKKGQTKPKEKQDG